MEISHLRERYPFCVDEKGLPIFVPLVCLPSDQTWMHVRTAFGWNVDSRKSQDPQNQRGRTACCWQHNIFDTNRMDGMHRPHQYFVHQLFMVDGTVNPGQKQLLALSVKQLFFASVTNPSGRPIDRDRRPVDRAAATNNHAQ